MKKLLSRLFGLSHKPITIDQKDVDKAVRESADPLDIASRLKGVSGWSSSDEGIKLKTTKDFPMHLPTVGDEPDVMMVGDSISAPSKAAVIVNKAVMDACSGDSLAGNNAMGGLQSAYTVPEQIANWYNSQGFIGYQACALIAQHWLVDKACSQAGEDASRNGWSVKTNSEDDLTDEQKSAIDDIDVKLGIKQQLNELNRFKNIFGIRVCIFKVDSDDPKYYEKPFNIDGVTKNSYRGIAQVDPYWMTPMMTSQSTSDPSSMFFYDPEYWIISGQKYHRTHLIISRGPQPADILKPTYIFGGIPLTQRIYERVYAAERTANEAPLLAMNKRTTAIHVDTDKAAMNEQKLIDKLKFWIRFRDNHAIKILGKEETMEQFDTSLSEFDSIIMNQYQLVASIARTPATKLLGTSPKGFNATGEFETISYHEELESIQQHVFTPFLDRHYLLTAKSMGLEVGLNIVWEAVDSMSAKGQADVNLTKAQTDQVLIASGSISPDESRLRVRDDKYSGFNNLTDDEANTRMGMNPDNLAKLEEAGAESDKGQANMMKGEAALAKYGSAEQPAGSAAPEGKNETTTEAQNIGGVLSDDITTSESPQQAYEREAQEVLTVVAALLDRINDKVLAEGKDIGGFNPSRQRTVKPSVQPSVSSSSKGIHDVVPHMDKNKLPKLKVGGMVMSIENPRGSVRRGQSIDGEWSCTMPHHYGFVKGTMGADGDEVDCFVGKNMAAPNVYVINQKDVNTGEFDEHKAMFGFDSDADAREAYHAAYPEGWEGFDSMQKLNMDEFKNWIGCGACNTPLDERCIINQTNSSPKQG